MRCLYEVGKEKPSNDAWRMLSQPPEAGTNLVELDECSDDRRRQIKHTYKYRHYLTCNVSRLAFALLL